MREILSGACLIAGGMALIALADTVVIRIAGEIGLWQFHVIRSGMMIPLAVGVALLAGGAAGVRRLRPRSARRVAERSLFVVLALMAYFSALPAVGIAQAAAGLFAAPVWVSLLAGTLFGERVGPRRLVGAALGFAGVCLAIGLGAEPLRPMSLVALAAGVFYALGVIWTRRHCVGESAACLTLWLFAGLFLLGLAGLAHQPWLAIVLAGVEGTAFATAPWRDLPIGVLGAVLGIGLASFLANVMLARGYQRGPSSIMSLFDFSFLLWAPFFAWALWGEAVGARTLAGMALILAAGVLGLWSGQRREAPAPAAAQGG